jgi:CO/xanthine dehydrogenase FAD-binding subunit
MSRQCTIGEKRRRNRVITEYRRPSTLDEALDLVARPDAMIVAGGTVSSLTRHRSPLLAVDLQDLPMSGIDVTSGFLRMGAMTTLSTIAEGAAVPGVLADLAHREVPTILANAATIGGTIGSADPESQVLTGLLAFGATVTVAWVGLVTEFALEQILDEPGLVESGIITEVAVPLGGRAAAERTGRTPMDTPIVLAVAHRAVDGELRLAMSGVAALPVVVDPEHISDLEPPADFRGSSAYRSHLATVLGRRVLHAVGGGG